MIKTERIAESACLLLLSGDLANWPVNLAGGDGFLIIKVNIRQSSNTFYFVSLLKCDICINANINSMEKMTSILRVENAIQLHSLS